MADLKKVLKGIECCSNTGWCMGEKGCPYWIETDDPFERFENCKQLLKDARELLKEQESMNVDAFVQWFIDSQIMGNATVRGIKYWVEKYKEYKKRTEEGDGMAYVLDDDNALPDFKPCPFCGREPALQIDKRYPKWTKDTAYPVDGYTIVCNTRECPIYHADNTWFFTKEDAVKAWNERKG